MTTANDLVCSALRVISSIAPGEAVPGAEADNALSALNTMLASWSASALMPPFRTLESFTLTIGQASYTVGTGANFSTPRPDDITNVFRRDSNLQDYPLLSYTKEQYDQVLLKSLRGLPQWYYYDTQYPNGVLYLYPTDIQADTLFIESLKPMNQFSALQTAMSLPGEYIKAIKYLLADELAVEYGFQIPPRLEKTIDDCRRMIMRKNVKPKVAGFDPALAGHARYNIFTDG